MYKYEKKNRFSVDNFIHSLNYMLTLNVAVLEPSSGCINFEMKRKDEQVLNILFP